MMYNPSNLEQIHYLAFHDILTKLPNRISFENKVKELLEGPQSKETMFAIFFIDLDRFKLINDTFGHTYGDLVLQKAAKRLHVCIPKEGMVARMGGDEFLCMLPIKDEQDAIVVVKKIVKQFSSPFEIRENEVYVTVSVGISYYPHDGDHLETLLTQADSAMYRAKKRGRNNYELAHAEVHASHFERLNIENMLRKAITEDQLVLYYQPQINMLTNGLEAVEALVRWHHPEYGVIPPNEFIPIAEDSGLILQIDEWVLRKACQQLHTWQTKGSEGIRVSVNLSAQQFIQTSLPDKINSLIEEYHLNPSLLEVEITETMVMQDTRSSMIQIGKIRETGVQVAIDDFGTGYSSFQYLKNFPVDSLKIDKIFIDDIDSNKKSKSIIKSMINLGHDLNLRVTAEGVETIEQLVQLKQQKCDSVQGYLFHKPLPTEEIDKLLANN